MTVGQGPTALAVDSGGGCLDILLSSFSLSGRRPKYCLKGPFINCTKEISYFYDVHVCYIITELLLWLTRTEINVVVFFVKLEKETS